MADAITNLFPSIEYENSFVFTEGPFFLFFVFFAGHLGHREFLVWVWHCALMGLALCVTLSHSHAGIKKKKGVLKTVPAKLQAHNCPKCPANMTRQALVVTKDSVCWTSRIKIKRASSNLKCFYADSFNFAKLSNGPRTCLLISHKPQDVPTGIQATHISTYKTLAGHSIVIQTSPNSQVEAVWLRFI